MVEAERRVGMTDDPNKPTQQRKKNTRCMKHKAKQRAAMHNAQHTTQHSRKNHSLPSLG